MFLSAITPRIGNARRTPQKIRKFSVSLIFILQICYTSPIQEINFGSASTYGFVNVHILNRQSWPRVEMVKKWPTSDPPNFSLPSIFKIEEEIAGDVRVELVLFLGILVLMELATQRLSLTKLLITGLLSLLGRGPVYKPFPRVFCILQLCVLINLNV